MHSPSPRFAETRFRVVVVMPLAHRRGGAERCLRDALAVPSARSVSWTVVFLEDGPLVDELRKLGADVSVLRAGRLRRPLETLTTIGRLTRILRASRADLVLAWMSKAQLYAAPAATLARVKNSWFQHGVPDPPDVLDRIATVLPADAVLACSNVAAEAQRRLRPSRRAVRVYPGIDLREFDPSDLPEPAEARRRVGLPADGPVIGTVGRLQRWKGVETLLRSFPEVLRSFPDAHCVVVGGKHDLEPDLPEVLYAQASRTGILERVTFAGHQADVRLWLQAMDVFVHVSDREPFGLAIVEAMALGKAVVAGSSGGPAEVLIPGVNGLLVPFGDDRSLASAVIRYLTDPSAAAQIGAAASRRAREFSAERFTESLLAALGDIIRPGGVSADSRL